MSQQIRQLEENLNLALFDRAHKTVRLTPFGREYQHTVVMALEHLSAATQDLRAIRGRARLTIAADQSMAWMWLMPRLGRYQEANPGVSVRVVVSDLESDCFAGNVDVAFVHGEGQWLGRRSTLLFPDEVYPVCAPEYLESAPPLAAPRDLAAHKLLHLEDDHWDWMNWRIWLTGNGVELPTGEGKLTINNYPLLIEAAKNGQGLALGWSGLVDRDLNSGALIRPLKESVRTRFGYHAVWPEHKTRLPQVEGFLDWILSDLPTGSAFSVASTHAAKGATTSARESAPPRSRSKSARRPRPRA